MVTPPEKSTSPPLKNPPHMPSLRQLLKEKNHRFPLSISTHLLRKEQNQSNQNRNPVWDSSPRTSLKKNSNLLQYEDWTLYFPFFICLCCSLIHHLHLPFQLCSLQTPIDISYGNSLSSSFVFLISFYNKCSSPKVAFSAYLIFLSHHPSLAFHSVPWSVCIIGQYKYCILCTISLKLDLCSAALQSSLVTSA